MPVRPLEVSSAWWVVAEPFRLRGRIVVQLADVGRCAAGLPRCPGGHTADHRHAGDEERGPWVGLCGFQKGHEDPPAEQPVLVLSCHHPGDGLGEQEQRPQDRQGGGHVGEGTGIGCGSTGVVGHGFGKPVGIHVEPFVGLTLSVRFRCARITYL